MKQLMHLTFKTELREIDFMITRLYGEELRYYIQVYDRKKREITEHTDWSQADFFEALLAAQQNMTLI